GSDQVMVRGRPRHVVSYMRDFLFEDAQAKSPVGSLSGGERNRLLLARALARPSNLLVLDEPTNDLDIETLDVLEDVLADYAGTLLLVSHDRDFLDRVVTSTIALEGDGEAIEYAGGFSDYLRQRVARKSEAPVEVVKPAADRPKRAQKKLTFKQQRELEALPAQMGALQDEIAGLEALMGDPDAYARDPDGFQAGVQRLEAARGERAALEERWLELEMLREELAGG
ncbi:MAG: ATP-binding cassette domain-containing protein, partial [Myxococcales bacterium]|nr:ATP-binding cassette domain-containing protein [Myxococcales bacterium]